MIGAVQRENDEAEEREQGWCSNLRSGVHFHKPVIGARLVTP